MYLELAEGDHPLSQNLYLQEDNMYLQENNMYLQEEGDPSPYLHIPGELGQEGIYVREDYFDDLPDMEWNEVMEYIETYSPELSIFGAKGRARRAARRAKRQQNKLQRIEARGKAGGGLGGFLKGIGGILRGGQQPAPAPMEPQMMAPSGLLVQPKSQMQMAMPWVLGIGGGLLLLGLARRRRPRTRR